MPRYMKICPQCKKEFMSSTVELLRYCSVGCNLDAANEEKSETEDQVTISVGPMVEVTYTYKQLEELHNKISNILYERRNKKFKDLGYEKPGPNTLTVGDLAGLKREE